MIAALIKAKGCYTRSEMTRRDTSTIAAWIGGAAVIIAALVGIVPKFWHPEEESQQKLVIAGTVVDDLTNAIGRQPYISLAVQRRTSQRIMGISEFNSDGVLRATIEFEFM